MIHVKREGFEVQDFGLQQLQVLSFVMFFLILSANQINKSIYNICSSERLSIEGGIHVVTHTCTIYLEHKKVG